MAYGYATGNYNPQIQKAGQAAAMTAKAGTLASTANQMQQQYQSAAGQQQQYSSPSGSPVTPTGQISQTNAPQFAPQQAPPPLPGAAPTQQSAAGQMAVAPQQQQLSPVTQSQQPAPPVTGLQTAPVPQPALPAYSQNPEGHVVYNYSGTPMMSQMQSLIMNALGNQLWSPEQVAQMKGAQKDATAMQQKQLGGEIDQRAAARGSLGSGQNEATQRRLAQGMNSDMLGGFRDIDLKTTEANRNALMSMLGMGQQFTGLDEGLKREAVGTALQNKGLDINKLLGLEGISAQREGNKMNAASSLISALMGYQGNMDQLGFNYTQLDANQRNSLINQLLGAF